MIESVERDKIDRYLLTLSDGLEPFDAAAGVARQINALHGEQIAYIHDDLIRFARDAQVVALAGRERMIRYGGALSPEIPEFAVHQLGAKLGISTSAAGFVAADTLSLVYRLPRVYAALREGLVTEWRARMVASATRDLALESLERVEGAVMAGSTAGDPRLSRLSKGAFRTLLDQLLTVEDPGTVEDQVETALGDRTVSIRHDDGFRGTSTLSGSMASADAHRLDQRLDQMTDWLRATGDSRTRHELRSVALGMLADPGTLDDLYAAAHASRRDQQPLDADPAPAPSTVLYVHHDRLSGTWSLDGDGPLTRVEAEGIVGHSRVRLVPVIDLAEDLTYTGYAAPPRLREQLALLQHGRCAFPHCDQRAVRGDYDHRVEYPTGPTSTRNGALLCRRHHRLRTHGGWHLRSPAPAVWIWGDRTDRLFLVTPEGTVDLN